MQQQQNEQIEGPNGSVRELYKKKLQTLSDYQDSKYRQSLYKDVSLSTEVALEGREAETILKPTIRIYCSGCELQVTRQAHIVTRSDYYCVACFSNLEEFPSQYLVRGSLKRSISGGQWDMMDQVLLITAFRTWGYSNWAQIKDYMDYNQAPFSLDQIKQHYQDYHYSQPQNLISVPSALPPSQPHTPYSQLMLKTYHETLPKENLLKRLDSKGEKKLTSMRSHSHIENEAQRGIKPSSVTEIESQSRQLTSYLKSQSSVLGYNPKRGEFETCYYDLEAQKLLDELEFYPDDTAQEYAIKIQMIEEYNRRLDQRAKRKAFVLEYKLLDSHYQLSQRQEQQKASLLFQPFMRFTCSHSQYKQLTDTFTTLTSHQHFITNLINIRNTTPNPTITQASAFLTRKRNKAIANWQNNTGKPFPDKKKRNIYRKKLQHDGTIILAEDKANEEENEENHDINTGACPIKLEDIEGHMGAQANDHSCVKFTELPTLPLMEVQPVQAKVFEEDP